MYVYVCWVYGVCVRWGCMLTDTTPGIPADARSTSALLDCPCEGQMARSKEAVHSSPGGGRRKQAAPQRCSACRPWPSSAPKDRSTPYSQLWPF